MSGTDLLDGGTDTPVILQWSESGRGILCVKEDIGKYDMLYGVVCKVVIVTPDTHTLIDTSPSGVLSSLDNRTSLRGQRGSKSKCTRCVRLSLSSCASCGGTSKSESSRWVASSNNGGQSLLH
jgi:hypothetical protein